MRVTSSYLQSPLSNRCQTFYYIHQISDLLSALATLSKYSLYYIGNISHMSSPGIFTLRTYAIYGRSRTVFFLLAVSALVTWSSGIVCFSFLFASGAADFSFSGSLSRRLQLRFLQSCRSVHGPVGSTKLHLFIPGLYLFPSRSQCR